MGRDYPPKRGGKKFGGKPSRGGFSRGKGKGGYGGNRQDREMFSTVCSECGKGCQVPFKPTGERPVLCSDCFGKNKPDDRRSGGPRREHKRERSFSSSSFSYDQERNSKRPPRQSKEMRNGRSEHYDIEFEKVHKKLDKIMQMLKPKHIQPLETTDEPEAVEPEVE